MTTAQKPRRAQQFLGTSESGKHYRADIQGLRALAVLLVILWHAGLPMLPGGYVGVDVFFVISGYLMTSLLYREIRTTGSIDLTAFWARRARRLVPASLFVLASMAIISWLVFPNTLRESIGLDVIASALFSMNWRMVSQSVDYLSVSGGLPSPFQHYWSLGVEEQFYFGWPLVLLLASWLAALKNRFCSDRGAQKVATLARTAASVMLVIFLCSLAFSIYYTRSNPSEAYFSTFTRIWELALGGLCVIISQSAAEKLLRRSAVGWIALAAIVLSAFYFDADTAFPGFAALLPTLGTAVLLIQTGGTGKPNYSPARVLSVNALTQIGGWSYSIYLWHWPILIAFSAAYGPQTLLVNLLLVTISFAPAIATFRYVESPLRSAPQWEKSQRAIQLSGFSIEAIVACALVAITFIPQSAPLSDQDPSNFSLPGAGNRSFGAATLNASVVGDQEVPLNNTERYYPTAEQIPNDTASGCPQSPSGEALKMCVFGDTSSSVNVWLIGDSHADQWVRAIADLGTQEHWRVTEVVKNYCPFVLDLNFQSPWLQSCITYRNTLLAAIETQKPQLVIASQYAYNALSQDGKLSADQSASTIRLAIRNTFTRVTSNGTAVAMIADTPHPSKDVAICIQKQPLTDCTFSRSEAVSKSGLSQQEQSLSGVPHSVFINANAAICPSPNCPPVIGGVLVYRDANHLTKAYAQTVAPRLLAAIESVLKS